MIMLKQTVLMRSENVFFQCNFCVLACINILKDLIIVRQTVGIQIKNSSTGLLTKALQEGQSKNAEKNGRETDDHS